MAISAAGVGSGLDVGSIINQLMAVERQPLSRLESQQKSYQSSARNARWNHSAWSSEAISTFGW